MQVDYTLTHADLVAFNDYHLRNSRTTRIVILLMLTLGVLAMLLLPATILLFTEDSRLEVAMDIWPLWVGPLLLAITGYSLTMFLSKRLIGKLVREGRNRRLDDLLQLKLLPEGITEQGTGEVTTRSWSSVERVTATNEHLFIYTSGTEAFVVPRRAFASEGEFEAWVNAIREKANVTLEASH